VAVRLSQKNDVFSLFAGSGVFSFERRLSVILAMQMKTGCIDTRLPCFGVMVIVLGKGKFGKLLFKNSEDGKWKL
jgi:hypothetical protein